MTNTNMRLDKILLQRGLFATRSQAENSIRLGKIKVNRKVVTKPGYFVSDCDRIDLDIKERYVSRAGLKLSSVAELLGVDFAGQTVLDVGSSTGGFTDYALQHGAKKVVSVDVGTEQLHPSLRRDKRIELHEKTDIRSVVAAPQVRPSHKADETASCRASVELVSAETRTADVPPTSAMDGLAGVELGAPPDIIVIDVSFISLREILPHIADNLCGPKTRIVAMLKPQFEAGRDQVNKGVIKNNKVRRQIVNDFEIWSRRFFVTLDKRDSQVAGAKGNLERFYLFKKSSKV